MSLYYPQGAITFDVRWEDFGSGDEALDKVDKMQILARSFTVELNDYNEADKFQCTIDYNSFPFDPRCIRALGVQVCLEDRGTIFKDNSLDLLVPSEENTIFIGFADESSIQFDDSTQTVDIEGRDFTSLFIDQKRVRTDPVPLTKRVDLIIQDIINEQEATKAIKIELRDIDENQIPVLSKVAEDFNPTKTVKNQRRKETYWDIIQSILSRTGLVGFIELDKFVITKPQNIYSKKELKQFIWGGNIKDLSFTRKLGRSKNFNVKVVSLNLKDKVIIEAKLPEDAPDKVFIYIEGVKTEITNPFIQEFGSKRITTPQLDKDGKKIEPEKDSDFISFRIPNVTDKDQLIEIGQGIYEEMSRQQIEGSLKTYEMEIPEELERQNGSVMETRPVSFNKIRNGSAVHILLSKNEISGVNSASSLVDKVKFLRARGYPEKIAHAFASSLNRINTPFYVKSVTFNLSQEDGFEMDIDFVNFIDIDNALLRK